MWGRFKVRVAAADVMSAAAVQQFFKENKMDAHFRRATTGKCQDNIKLCHGEANFVTIRSFHFCGTSGVTSSARNSRITGHSTLVTTQPV
jgi:hypothetical protein